MLTLIGCLIFDKACRKFCQYGCFQAVIKGASPFKCRPNARTDGSLTNRVRNANCCYSRPNARTDGSLTNHVRNANCCYSRSYSRSSPKKNTATVPGPVCEAMMVPML